MLCGVAIKLLTCYNQNILNDMGVIFMALIICPECGKEISDKSETCIHCGYPLINYTCKINDKEYNLKDELSMALVNNDDWIKAIGSLRRKTSLTLSDGDELIELMRSTKSVPNEFVPKYPLEDRSKYENKTSNVITCPYCHSTDTKKITNASKAVHTALFGVFSVSRNSKNYHCNKCNSDF